MGWLRRIHRWIGLALLVPLILEGVTGTVLVIAAWPQAETAGVAGTGSANAVLAAAVVVAPQAAQPRMYRAGRPATVMFSEPGPGRGLVGVRVDPASLRIVEGGGGQNAFVDISRRLHANLILPDWGGRSLIGWEGVGLALLVVFGIPLWWPRRSQMRAAFTVPLRARGFLLHRRLHGALGIWLLPVMLLAAVTGVALRFPQDTRALLGLPAFQPGRMAAAASGPMAPIDLDHIDLDGAIALARVAVPDGRLRMASLPASARDSLRLTLVRDAAPDAPVQVSVTADGARLISVQTPSDLSIGEQVIRLSHTLHEGAFWGVAGRVLVVLGGVALPVFAATGGAMWLIRRRTRARLAAARQPVLQDAD